METNYEGRFEELSRVTSKKSNIKDVCALLDMKSSKYTAPLTSMQTRKKSIKLWTRYIRKSTRFWLLSKT